MLVALSVARVLLPFVCFKALILESGKRYGKKAFYQVDRYSKYLSNSFRALLLHIFSFPSYEVLKKGEGAISLPLMVLYHQWLMFSNLYNSKLKEMLQKSTK